MSPKKLIETSIPLDAINKASATEKSIRKAHPSTLHLWWSRKPLATARAVLWASLVDDPGTESGRKDLHAIMEELVQWKNTNNPDTLRKARAKLPENLPELLDPFAGGGTIPLEGQRLGLKVHARDLNPVAVVLNKAMIELPAQFAGQPPVNPDSRRQKTIDTVQNGLAEDIEYYGEKLMQKARRKLARLYPDYDGRKVIAWLWARTVKCPNPSCGLEVPLATSWELSRKTGANVLPIYDGGKLSFVVRETGKPKTSPKTGKGVFSCSACGAAVSNDYLHEEFCGHRDGVRMIAVVCEGEDGKGRVYLPPTEVQERAANVSRPEDCPDAEMMGNNRYISPRLYGMPNFADLFTNRQLTMLTTIAGLIPEVLAEVQEDEGSRDYAEALGVYLAFLVDKMLLRHSMFSAWDRGYDKVMMIFGRQAIPMVWDYAEANPFSDSSGSFKGGLNNIVDAVKNLPFGVPGEASQHDAHEQEDINGVMVSTDPPYYDNIGYADLSDYFYIWMRQVLRKTYPELFRRILVPKSEELIAAPHRHGGNAKEARSSFEAGMFEACKNLYAYSGTEYPATIYYAYKAGDKDGGNSGWETMLDAVIRAGFQITGTWPMRTELTTALKANVSALASSIVLVCRKRDPSAAGASKAAFLRELRAALPGALKVMQEGGIAAVDLPQSAIGPGMAVYSKYPRVLSADGTPLTVRDALKEINAAIDEYMAGVLGDFDSITRFCAEMYAIRAFNPLKAGDVITLANAKSITLDTLRRARVIVEDKGDIRLADRDELTDSDGSLVWVAAQRMVNERETGGKDKDGIEACAKLVKSAGAGLAGKAKELAYYLYNVADRKKWAKEAALYNSLIMSWGAIMDRADSIKQLVELPEQKTLGLEESR